MSNLIHAQIVAIVHTYWF